VSTRRDWLKWVAASCALVATASAEYSIAVACHFPVWVAWCVPGALDAYVLRALQREREVLTAVLAMVTVNAASHLVTAGMLPVDWRLVTAVSAIAPLVLWRVHALRTPGEARRAVLWGTPVPPVTLEEHADAAIGGREEQGTGNARNSTFDEHVDSVPGVSIYVPAEWSAPVAPVSDGADAACVDDTDRRAVPSVPDPGTPQGNGVPFPVLTLPAGFEAGERPPARPFPELLAEARELFPASVPTIREIKEQMRVGTGNAQRIAEELRNGDQS